ncbi:hypothetical protein ACKI1H_17250 [Pseudomonas sp. YH-1]|uniref:hypothetical protein n=1 Tax=Pseudomonas sp. YH-1 TaxID=3384787 RepID=UPI003F7D6299
METMEIVSSLLMEYISEAEKNEFLRDHDSRFQELRSSVKKKSANLRPPLNVVSQRLYTIADHSFYCVELFNYKCYLLAKGIIHALETSNPLSLANNCHSLLEQIATLNYCMQAIEEMINDLKDQGALEKINNIILKAETTLQRTYAGRGGKKGGPKEEEAIHVSSSIRELQKIITDAQQSYDYLCEFVHPNYGNNLLISSGVIGTGKIGSRENSDESIKKIASISCNLLNFSRKVNHTTYPYLTWQAHHYVEICLQKGAKITNVFSTKKPVPQGDGRSKETAFFFKNARTSQEAIALSYQYLTETGSSIDIRRKTNGGAITENGIVYIYDIWKTESGTIWFKIPGYKGI